MNLLIQVALSLSALSFALAPANAAEPSFTGIPVEGLDQLKLTLEARIEHISGHPVLCKDEVKQCIEDYDQLVILDWSKSTIEKGKRIIVSRNLPNSNVHSEYAIVNIHESSSVLKRILGSEIQTNVSAMLTSLAAPLDSSVSSAIVSCPAREKYYDDLFKTGEFDVTIVWGYFDEHDDTFSGVLAEQMFKIRKIPISIQENNQELKQMLELLHARGFQLDSQGPTDWHLSRPFYYKGERKLARVHLYNSTVKCSGEIEKDGQVQRYDNDRCEEQVAATARSLKAFTEAFGKSQLIVYNGHSRLGRGPDFGPLGTRAGKFTLALGGLDEVNINNTKTILFMGSCDSLDYFQRGVDKKQHEIPDPEGLMMLGITGDGSWKNSAAETARLIQMLMEARCTEDITNVMNLPRHSDWNYQVNFSEAFSWFHSREPEEADGKSNRIPKYQIQSDKDGNDTCYAVSAKGRIIETPVDEQYCEVSYKTAKANNGNIHCYLADSNDKAFGQPVDDAFCKDDEEDDSQ